ncbi:sensor histidine kinase [Bifidobacterium goeldii]|nr:histidine kinase [Bifidobacterium goeldii]
MDMTRRLTTIRDTFVRDRKARMLAIDSAVALLATLAFGLLFGTSVGNMPGMLFAYDSGPMSVWSAVLALPLALRRVRPQTAAAVFAGLTAVQLVAGPAMVPSDFLALIMLYSVIVYGDPRNTTAFIVLASALGAAAGPVMAWSLEIGPFFDPYITAAEYAQGAEGSIRDCHAVYAGGGFTGSCAQIVLRQSAVYLAEIAACLIAIVIAAFWQRARLITIRMMQERNDAIQASEAEERHIAALAERARIARDMHDVVAHTLSIIIVQSDGGRYAGAHDPAVARSTMETIRHESERALHDMKRLFGVFGGSSHADYADIGALVEQAHAAAASTPDGGTVQRRITGLPQPQMLAPASSAAVYHLVQEALTNVRKYAGPNAHVLIDEHWSDSALDITVTDDGRGATASLDGHKPGYGLLGMRERVEAAGGTLEAGPRIGGGFMVHAHLPLASAHAYSTQTSSATVNASPVTQSTPVAQSTNDSARAEAPADLAEQTSNRAPRKPEHGVFSPTLPRVPSWASVYKTIRSKPIAQAVLANGQSFNWIERLSQWTERHYLATDIIGTMLLIGIMFNNPMSLLDGYTYGTAEQAINQFIVITTMLPLCLRRRFPESSAAMVALASAFQLIVFQPVMFSNLFSLCALYSAVLYGRANAWRWTSVVSAANAMLFGFKVMLSNLGYASILHWLLRTADYTVTGVLSTPRQLLQGFAWTLVIGVICMGTILLARWHRSSGANVLVLQAREEALREEQRKQRILAANMERDRISSRIQAEVSATLSSVIDRAVAGIRMLDDAAARGEEPSADAIQDAFAAIGAQGRVALKHMRQLLSVLRETGFSDEAHDHAQPEMQLRPAASLDEQLRHTAERHEE